MSFREFLEWNKISRQRQFPWENQPDNPYQRRPDKELAGDDYQPQGYYHVTPFKDRVLASGVLKSRRQIENERDNAWRQKKAEFEANPEYHQWNAETKDRYLKSIKKGGAVSMGLGSGSSPHSAKSISLTYNYDRAVSIYEEFKYVAKVVRNEVSAWDIYTRFENMDDDRFDDEELSGVESLLVDFGVPAKHVRNGDRERCEKIINKKVNDPERKYDFFQELEKAITEKEMKGDQIGELSVMGFTAPFAQMKLIQPEQIAIFQCVVRKNAHMEQVPEEAEVRVSSDDVAIVRYLQP